MLSFFSFSTYLLLYTDGSKKREKAQELCENHKSLCDIIDDFQSSYLSDESQST